MSFRRSWLFSALLFCLGLEVPAEAGTLIVNARLIDGTGAPSRAASVRIDGDRIVALGDLAPAPGEAVFDARGLVLAPGFIDTHSHAGGSIFEQPAALGAVSQGITTVVVGQDGGSQFPLGDSFGRLGFRGGIRPGLVRGEP